MVGKLTPEQHIRRVMDALHGSLSRKFTWKRGMNNSRHIIKIRLNRPEKDAGVVSELAWSLGAQKTSNPKIDKAPWGLVRYGGKPGTNVHAVIEINLKHSRTFFRQFREREGNLTKREVRAAGGF